MAGHLVMSAFTDWYYQRNFGNVRSDSNDEDLAERAFSAGMTHAADLLENIPGSELIGPSPKKFAVEAIRKEILD